MLTLSNFPASAYRVEYNDAQKESRLFTDTILGESLAPGASLPSIEVRQENRVWRNQRTVRTTREMYFDTPREAWENYIAEYSGGIEAQQKILDEQKQYLTELYLERERAIQKMHELGK